MKSNVPQIIELVYDTRSWVENTGFSPFLTVCLQKLPLCGLLKMGLFFAKQQNFGPDQNETGFTNDTI